MCVLEPTSHWSRLRTLCEDELDVLLDCFEPISVCVDVSLDLVHELIGYIHKTKWGAITFLPLYQLLHYLF